MKKWIHLPRKSKEPSERIGSFFTSKYCPYEDVRTFLPQEELEEMIAILRKKSQEQNDLYFIQKFRNKETEEIIRFINFREDPFGDGNISDYTIVHYMKRVE